MFEKKLWKSQTEEWTVNATEVVHVSDDTQLRCFG